MVRANLAKVYETIDRACRRSGRNKNELTFVAVSKKVPKDLILEASECGVGQFGESYVQEAREKIEALRNMISPVWHMLGHLQTNKAKDAVRFFDTIQSLDSIKLAKVIDRHARELGKVQNCFIEVNISGEVTKKGIDEKELGQFLSVVESLKNIKIEGMMLMAPFFETPEPARPFFARARKIFERLFLEKSGTQPRLSMGMSGDYEVAIEEGSTMVRIGQAIFGARR